MQFSLRNLIIATAAVAFCLVFVRSDSKRGSVIVSQQNEKFVYTFLAEQGIDSYESYSFSGLTRFFILDAHERSSIEEAIERDALAKGYNLKIKHQTILPPFSSERIVNAEVSLSGDH